MSDSIGWRRSRPLRNLPALTAVILGMTACGSDNSDLPEVSLEEGEWIVEVAEPAAAALLRTLVGRLTDAMEAGGPVQAIEFCSTEAVPLTRMVESGIDGDVGLKRTSFRYRNLENAPDEAEEEALLYFERAVEADGHAPSSYVQRVSSEELRYYQPLFMSEFCLQCHGNRDSMDPEVQRVLSERYPYDLATGYQVGDFRGVVRVSVQPGSR
jgi:hypothetical protein